MIRPRRANPLDDIRDNEPLLAALRRARAAAARRHAAAGLPLLDWHDGRIVLTDAMVLVTMDKKSEADAAGMTDNDNIGE